MGEIISHLFGKLKKLFAQYPATDKFYVTADDSVFFEQHHAEGHASSLKDKTVTVRNRIVHETFDSAMDKVLAKGQTAPELPNDVVKTEDIDKDAEGEKPVDDSKTEGDDSDKSIGNADDKATGPSEAEKEALQVLKADYLALFGKKPNGLMKPEKIKAAIDARRLEIINSESGQ